MSIKPSRSDSRYANPLIASRGLADPWVCKRDGVYYLTGTVESEDRILVWSGPELSGLDGADPTCVWLAEETGGASAQIWAPELHCLEDRYWIYFTAGDGRDEAHRHFFVTAEAPLGPYCGPRLVDPTSEQYAIDGSVLNYGGILYWLYATYDGLWIAPMDSPGRVGSYRQRIAVGDQSWEHAWHKINGEWVQSRRDYWIEGPQALLRNNRLFVAYSAGHSATPHYAMGLLECSGDPMRVDSWVKHPGPVFGPRLGQSTQGVVTVGHASFTTSPDETESWIIYHGKDIAGSDFTGRTTRMQKFDWVNDFPHFGCAKPTGMLQNAPSGEGGNPFTVSSKQSRVHEALVKVPNWEEPA